MYDEDRVQHNNVGITKKVDLFFKNFGEMFKYSTRRVCCSMFQHTAISPFYFHLGGFYEN